MRIFRPLKLKVKVLTPGCEPEINKKGDWIDVRSAKDFTFYPPSVNHEINIIPLGFAMALPQGFEAICAPRSSTYKNYGFILANSFGVIDNSYSGDNDEWGAVTLSFKESNVKKFDRICQFRIQLSQKATVWQKLKWLFTSGVELEFVEHLSDEDRGGFGSTGKK